MPEDEGGRVAGADEWGWECLCTSSPRCCSQEEQDPVDV